MKIRIKGLEVVKIKKKKKKIWDGDRVDGKVRGRSLQKDSGTVMLVDLIDTWSYSSLTTMSF